MNFEDTEVVTMIATKLVGPIKINHEASFGELVYVPMATFETPLWHSTKRGAIVSQKTSGINVSVIGDCMTRSIILEAPNIETAVKTQKWIALHFDEINEVICKISMFTKLQQIHIENVGRLLYVRFAVETGNASGHNMVTQAADTAIDFITSRCDDVKYVSISGNYCVDKKNSSINGILGRGKRVSAEIVVSREICASILRTTPERIVDLNVKKNLIGSILSGGVRTANAHFANVALAIYLATGQDAANIVEASQGMSYADIDGDDLYFSVTIPNIIVGTVGNGKDLNFALENLMKLGCSPENPLSSKRLAAIIAAATLCAELSLMSAQSNRGELMKAHTKLERP
jgi:hydroxymethylglutaryl-CoA reductase (NADPH)